MGALLGTTLKAKADVLWLSIGSSELVHRTLKTYKQPGVEGTGRRSN